MLNSDVSIDDNGIIRVPYESDPRLAGLIGPGGPFEIAEVVVDGVATRTFVHAPQTILDAFAIAAVHGDGTHVVAGAERLSFTDVRERALTLAGHLRSDFGVGVGDRVGIAMRNMPEFVVAFWSVAVLGAIVVPLNAWWTGPELRYAIDDAGAALVFADEQRAQRLTEDGVASKIPVIAVTSRRDLPGVTPFADLLSGTPLGVEEIASVATDDPATMLYTSGTTGRPKGALVTHRNILTSIMNMGFATTRESVLSGRPPAPAGQPGSITAAPLFHIGGIAGIIGGALSGMKLVLMSKWNTDEAIRLARAEAITTFGGVPTMARAVLDHPGAAELKGSVRGFPMGGASVSPDLPRRADEIFGGTLQMLNGYGSTETTSAVATNVGVEYAARPDSVGRVNLTAELRVIGADGSPVGLGEIGELCFRSPQNVKGYWNDAVATKASFVEGWFHTGDLGYVDDEGYIYIVDRLKDVVIRGGENVYCAEVEAALFEHPLIADVAVIGVPDDRMGERVCAVVVTRAGAELEPAQLRDFAVQRIAVFKAPEALYIADAEEIPRTATGKVAKKALRQVVADNAHRIRRA